MKKLFALVVVAVLCMTFAVSAMAEDYTLDANGNAVFENTIGYSFKIDDINGTITGEDSTILTSVDGIAGCGVWSVYLVADRVSDNVYVAATDGTAMGGNPANVSTLADGQIIVVIHSASAKPTDAATYPNWEACARASAIKTGDYLVLSGIDLAAGTCTNGTMTVTTKENAGVGDIVTSDAESSEAESSDVESSEATAESSAADTSAVSSVASSAAESSDASDSDADEGGLGAWLYVIIGVAVLAVVAVVAVVLKKKK